MATNSKLRLSLQKDSDDNLLSGVGPGVGVKFIEAYFPKAQNTIKIASAYFTLKGYKLGREFISSKVQLQVLVGREEGVHVQDALIDEIIKDFGNCDEVLHDVISDLRQRIIDGRFVIKDARELQVKFHCKFYICDDRYICHGSANYTGKGLAQSAEQVSVSTDLEQITLFSHWYDEASQNAHDVSTGLVERLKTLIDLVDPFDVYLKTLFLLNSLSDLKRKPNAKIPTYYQMGVVANAIEQAEKFGGGLIVAATGLGKTTIGTEIALQLQLGQKIKRVILIAPKGVMKSWKEEFDNLDIPVAYFTINVFFLGKPAKNETSQIKLLERTLRNSDNETLIIIDEVHFFRNQLTTEQVKGKKSRVYKRLVPLIGAGAKVFLLTATVYGTSYLNLNSLLYLLPHRKIDLHNKLSPWEVKDADEFTKLPVVTILGLPHVLKLARERGDIDKNGRTFIKLSNEICYLPEKIKLYSISYSLFLLTELQNAFDNRCFDQADKIPSLRYDDDAQSLLEGVTDASRNSAIESWLSSSSAMSDSIEENFLQLGKSDLADSTDNIEHFQSSVVKTNKTLLYLSKRDRKQILMPIAARLGDVREDKVEKLFDILNEHCAKRKSKVIVFVNRHRTAQHLLTELEKYFNGEMKIGCTVETREGILKLSPYRSEILEKFSPRSQKATEQYEQSDESSVLICTDADGVGVNLQDADTVVNYDPPKSADILFQRAGRVLRMTADPSRIVHLYNLVPSLITSFDTDSTVCENIRHIFERMKSRHAKSSSILGSSVIPDNEYTETNLDDSEIDIEKFTQENDALESIGGLWTKSMLSHTAILEGNRPKAEGLSDFILSARTHPNTVPYMFVLVEFRREYFPVLYDIEHEYIWQDTLLQILDMISCTDTTPMANVSFSDVELYANEAVKAWCELKKLDLSSVRKICGVYLQPSNQAKSIKNYLKVQV